MKQRVQIRWWLATAVGVAMASPVAYAGEKYVYDMHARGSVRMMGAYMHFPSLDLTVPPTDDALAASVARVMLDGGLGQYVNYEINAFADLSAGGGFGGAFATVGSLRTPYRTEYLAWDYWNEGRVAGRMGIDRANLRILAGQVDAVVGRQVINHSVTGVFSPNDFFAPFSATAINRIYKPGVDAVHVGWSPWAMTTFSVDAVLGNDTDDVPSWQKSGVLGRASTVAGGFEGAVLGGKLADRYVVGGSLQGELGPVGLRAEGHAGFSDRDVDGTGAPVDDDDDVHGRVAVGLEVPLPWRSAIASAEYAYYSDGADDPSDYFSRYMQLFPDDQVFGGQHYAGANFSIEVMPLLYAAAFGLVNAGDGSGMAGISGMYSVADEAEFLLGSFVPWGKRPNGDSGEPMFVPNLRSEFGQSPVVVYLETRFYF